MALTLDLSTTPIGLTVNGAYARIVTFQGDKDRISVDVAFFASVQARLDGARELDFQRHALEIAGGASMAGMYQALKALPEFAGAEDC